MTIKGRPVNKTSLDIKGADVIGANVTSNIKSKLKFSKPKVKDESKSKSGKPKEKAEEKAQTSKGPKEQASRQFKSSPNKVAKSGKVSNFNGVKVTDSRAVGGVSAFSPKPKETKSGPRSSQPSLPGMSRAKINSYQDKGING
jgi:hypothetical protein